MQLAFAAQMRELDRRTIEEIGIPGMVLMENAGRGTVNLMERTLGPVRGKTVCIFAGPGNNGGDGLVIARTVHGLGAFPFVFFLLDPEQMQGDAALNFAILKRLRLPYQVLDYSEKMLTLIDTVLTLNRIHPVHCLVDALFGTGLARDVSGPFLDAINCINILRERHRLPVVSVDIPSGLNSDTGAILGTVVQADLTVTYGLPKPGQFHHGGAVVGRLERLASQQRDPQPVAPPGHGRAQRVQRPPAHPCRLRRQDRRGPAVRPGGAALRHRVGHLCRTPRSQPHL
jgi:NAD(P)H-hydrate epimerase